MADERATSVFQQIEKNRAAREAQRAQRPTSPDLGEKNQGFSPGESLRTGGMPGLFMDSTAALGRAVGEQVQEGAANQGFLFPGEAYRANKDTGRETSNLEKFGIGAANMLTLGNLGRVNAAREQGDMRAAIGVTGSNDAALADAQGFVRENVETLPGLLGEVAGAVPRRSPAGAVASGTYNALNKIPAFGRWSRLGSAATSGEQWLGRAYRIGAGSMIGGAEAAIYAGGMGYSAEEAQSALLTGGLLGGGLQVGMEVLGALASTEPVKKAIRDVPASTAAENLIDLLRATMPEAVDNAVGVGMINKEVLTNRLTDPSKPLVSQIPDTVMSTVDGMMRRASKDGNLEAWKAIKTLNGYFMSEAANATADFQEAYARALGTPTPRSVTEMMAQRADERKQLSTEMEAAKQRLTTQGSFSVQAPDGSILQGKPTTGNFKKFVAPFFEQQGNKPVNRSVKEAEEFVKGLVESYSIPSVRRSQAGPGPSKKDIARRTQTGDYTPLSGQHLYSAIKELDEYIFNGNPKVGSKPSAVDKDVAINHLLPLRDALKDFMYQLDPLDAAGDSGSMRNVTARYAEDFQYNRAYDAGQAVFKNANSPRGTDYLQLFSTTRANLSPAEKEAFVEGYKRSFFNAIAGKEVTPNAVNKLFAENSAGMQEAESIIGKDTLNALRSAADQYTLSVRLGKQAANPPGPDVERSIKPLLEAGLDYGLMGLALGGTMSSGVAGGAGRRQAAKLGGLAPDGAASRDGAMAALLAAPPGQAADAANSAAARLGPTMANIPLTTGYAVEGEEQPQNQGLLDLMRRMPPPQQ